MKHVHLAFSTSSACHQHYILSLSKKVNALFLMRVGIESKHILKPLVFYHRWLVGLFLHYTISNP